MKPPSKMVALLVTALMAAVTLSACQPDDEPSPSETASTSVPSPSATETPTDPGTPSQSPEPTSTIDPADFEGFPPPVVFDAFFARTGTNDIPYPDTYGEFHVIDNTVFKNPDRSLDRKGSVQASYEDGQGRSFLLHVNPNFGSYAGTMRAITGHREVGISICGTGDLDVTHCAAASDDADLTISGLMEAEELDAILQEVVAFYQERA